MRCRCREESCPAPMGRASATQSTSSRVADTSARHASIERSGSPPGCAWRRSLSSSMAATSSPSFNSAAAPSCSQPPIPRISIRLPSVASQPALVRGSRRQRTRSVPPIGRSVPRARRRCTGSPSGTVQNELEPSEAKEKQAGSTGIERGISNDGCRRPEHSGASAYKPRISSKRPPNAQYNSGLG